MKCKEIKKLILYELDAVITTDQLHLIEEHTKICTTCIKERKELFAYRKKISECFTNLPVPELSNGFNYVFYRRLSQQKTLLEKLKEIFIPVISRRVFVPATVLAVAVFLILILLPEKQEIKIGMENYSTTLIKCAVIKTENAEIENTVDTQVKKLLQNFL